MATRLKNLTAHQFLDDAGIKHPMFPIVQVISDLGPKNNVTIIKEYDPEKSYMQPRYFFQMDQHLARALATMYQLARMNNDALAKTKASQ